eukprot:342269-Chlamydomonas_euryale.AAC.1
MDETACGVSPALRARLSYKPYGSPLGPRVDRVDTDSSPHPSPYCGRDSSRSESGHRLSAQGRTQVYTARTAAWHAVVGSWDEGGQWCPGAVAQRDHGAAVVMY